MNAGKYAGLALAGLVVLGAGAQEQPKGPATLAALRQQLTEQISQPKYSAALWGVKIVSLDSGKTIFEHNSQKLFSPASNCKLYTVALALDRLGPDFRIRTCLYGVSRPKRSGTLKGDLILYGRGDPTINTRLHSGDIFKALEPLVDALTNAGVKRIAGDLVGDQSFIRGPEFGSGWAWDDAEYYYGAELSALTINDNTLSVNVLPAVQPGSPCRLLVSPASGYLSLSNRTTTVSQGQKRFISFYRPLGENVVYVSGQMPASDPGYTEDVPIHRPAALFVQLFKDALARGGIKIKGRLRTMTWLDRQVTPMNCSNFVELGSVESPAIRDLVREVQKPSQNLYADLLLAQVGEQARSNAAASDLTSEELGLRELQKFLSQAGVKPGEVLFEEGAGLSRNNLATPDATVALLRYMSGHPCGEIYRTALPIAGVDGTLRNRMKGTPAAGNVRAKTGTLRWANSLSGYVTSAAGERLAFCLMLNRYYNPSPGASARNDLDVIAVLLASFNGRSTE